MKHKKIAVAAKYIIWLILAFAVCMVAVNAVFGATNNVSPSVDLRQATAANWVTLAVTRPTGLWFWGDGNVGYDYTTKGSAADVTAWTDGNAPGLAEGLLTNDQSGASFDGVNDYLTKDVADPPITSNSFTIMAVARCTGPNATGSGIQSLFNQRDDGATCLVQLAINRTSTGFPQATFRSATGVIQQLNGVETLVDSEWHVLAMTAQDGGEDSLRFFVDGVLVASAINNQPDDYTTSLDYVAVGRNRGGGVDEGFLVGDHCWLGIWNGTVLTTAQVSTVTTALMPTGASGDPYASLQSAVHQGAAGDTILIADGRYQETVTVAKAFDYIGASVTTFGSWPEFYGTDLIAASGNDGFIVSADNEIGYLTIRGYYKAGGIGVQSSSTALFHHIEIDSCLTGFDFGATTDTLAQSTIDGALLGSGVGALKDGANTSVMLNTIIYNCVTGSNESAGTLGGGYNNYFGNTTNYASMSALTGDMAVNPRFFNSTGNDYRVRNNQLKNGTPFHSQAAPFTQVYIGAWFPVNNLNIADGGGSHGGRSGNAREGWSRGSHGGR